MATHRSLKHIIGPILALTVLLGVSPSADAGGLNTNVALSPPEDGWIIRSQWRYTEFKSDPIRRSAAMSE